MSAVLADGHVQPLLHIGNWDFDWQDQYHYVTPIRLPAGETLRMGLVHYKPGIVSFC